MIEKLIKTDIDDYPWKDESGCHYSSKLDYIQTSILGFCMCGKPEDIVLYVKEMLGNIASGKCGNYEDMSYMFFVSWADNKGFATHGTTVRCSWLTDKGKELLRDLECCLSDAHEES